VRRDRQGRTEDEGTQAVAAVRAGVAAVRRRFGMAVVVVSAWSVGRGVDAWAVACAVATRPVDQHELASGW